MYVKGVQGFTLIPDFCKGQGAQTCKYAIWQFLQLWKVVLAKTRTGSDPFGGVGSGGVAWVML